MVWVVVESLARRGRRNVGGRDVVIGERWRKWRGMFRRSDVAIVTAAVGRTWMGVGLRLAWKLEMVINAKAARFLVPRLCKIFRRA